MSIAPGIQLTKRYQILSKLGEGGFGTTFLAKDLYLPGRRVCVVKQLKSQAADSITWTTAKRLFDTEAQTLDRLGNHPQIPELFAYFEEDRQFYLVEEYIPGQSLTAEIAADRSLKDCENNLIDLLQEILEILEYVHENRVIHRDINPNNIIRRKQDNKLVLIDFGAVKQITQDIIAAKHHKYTISIGTPGYRPSEQANGNPKLSSDIYAVGSIALQILTECPPHTLSLDPKTGELNWDCPEHISSGLKNVLDRMVRYDWRERYQSATEAKEALIDLIDRPKSDLVTIAAAHTNKAKNKPKQKIITSFNTNFFLDEPNIFGSCLSRILILMGLFAVGMTGMASVDRWQNFLSASKFYDRGVSLSREQDYEKALDLYDRAIEVSPNYQQAWKGQADVLHHLQRYDEAKIAYEKAVSLQPSDWQAWLGLAKIRQKLGEEAAAIAAFEKVTALQPNDLENWQTLAQLQLKLGRYRDSLVALQKSLTFQPENPQLWYQKGYALQNLQEYQLALDSYNKSLLIQPKNYQTWYHRGNVLMNLKEYRQAEKSYRKSVTYRPNFYQAWYSRAMAYSYLKDYSRAIYSFDRALKIKSNNSQAWYHRGWANHQLKKYSEAISNYNKAIKYKSNYDRAWYNRGNAYYNLKEYNKAIESYNKAIKIKPNYPQAWYSRGSAFLKLGKLDRARYSYDRALEFNPNYEAAKARKKLLK
ncbi:MAG: tetratricopeptide repeat protein [Prochloraceae cyanobacterium]